MIEKNLLEYEQWIRSFLESLAAKKFWIIKVSALCFGLVLFCSFPPYETFLSRAPDDTWSIVLKQIENPLSQPDVADPASHNAKRAFRLFVPTVARILHIHNIYALFSIQLIVAFALFYLVIKLSFKISGDKVTAILTGLAVSFTYSGQVGIVDTLAKFDGIAIAALIAALCTRSPLLIFLCCFASAWTDERGLIACGLVWLWWQIQEAEEKGKEVNWTTILTPKVKSGSVIAAGLSYLALRFYLQHEYHLQTVNEGTGIGVFLQQFNMVTFGLWSAFEGLWMIIFGAVFVLMIDKKYTLLILVILTSMASITVSFLVLDITRSLIYCLPLLFISLQIIAKTENAMFLRRMMLACLIVCALVPTYFAEGGFRIEGSNPFFLKLIDFLRNIFS